MSQIEYSSVPTWARPGTTVDDLPAPAATGSSYLVVGVGEVADVLAGWEAILPPRSTTRIHGDVDSAVDALATALSGARVGVRVWIVADAGAALRLRACAGNAGLEDDEIDVVTVSVDGLRDLFCAHCRTVNRVAAAIDDVVPCAECGRDLLVYHHVSRRSGAYLGFMVDAENPNPENPTRENPGAERRAP